MARIKKNHSNKFKFKVALTALKGDKTVAELCQEFSLVASQIYAWKKQLEQGGQNIFADKRKEKKDLKRDIGNLRAKIGELVMERDFLSNALGQFK